MLARSWMVVTMRSCARCGRESDYDLRRDPTPAMRDNTDTDNRGVSDPKPRVGTPSRPDAGVAHAPVDVLARHLTGGKKRRPLLRRAARHVARNPRRAGVCANRRLHR